MKMLMTGLIALPLFSWGFELVLPDYRNSAANIGNQMIWRAQLEDAGLTVTANSGVPIPALSDFLKTQVDRALVVELPPVFYQTAVESGWKPYARLETPGMMGLFVLADFEGELQQVATPPANTAAYKVATRLSDAALSPQGSHGDCLRAMVAGNYDGCITSHEFANAYAGRFGIAFAQIGPLVPVGPSLMMASPNVSSDLFSKLNEITISFPSLGARFIPFDADRDIPLLTESF